jgi:FKBP-type peptidyl-prolyl cis-trans isomerase (trigger factor)
VLAKLKELNVFDVPNVLIQEEMQRMAQAIQAQAARQKQKVQINDMSRFTEQARDNVITGLLMREAMIAFDLKVEPSHVTKLLEEKMSAYENPAQMMQMYYNSEELIEQVKGEAMEMLLVDALLNTAKIEEERVSFEKAIQSAHNHEHGHDHDHDHDHDHE